MPIKKMPKMYSQIEPRYKAKDLFDLSGKVALIVGGGGRIGKNFAITLASNGARVCLADINQKSLNLAYKDVYQESGEKALKIQTDISKKKSVKSMYRTIMKEYGRLDVLIYSVMTMPKDYHQKFEKYDERTWRKVFDVNMHGAFLCCQQASQMIQKGGSIILISSIYGMVSPVQTLYKGLRVQRNIYNGEHSLSVPAAYTVAKAGLVNLSQYLATLLAPKHVRVNAISPGGIYDGQEPLFHRRYKSRTPLGRMGIWSDFNGAILFLASGASSYMTGANLVVDGGWTAW